MGGVAQTGLPKPDDAIPVEDKVSGKGIDFEHLLHGAREVEVFGPVHVLLVEEGAPDAFVLVGADAYHFERLARVFLLQVAQDGDRFAAGRAPRAPKFEQNDLAAKGSVGNLLILARDEREVRGKGLARANRTRDNAARFSNRGLVRPS